MRRLLCTVLGVCLLQGVLLAQDPPAPPPAPKPPAAPGKPAPPPPPPPAPPPAPAADAPNIRLELRITDTYSGTPVEKIVSMLVLSGRNGRVRTSNAVPVGIDSMESVTLNVDAVVTAQPRDQVQAQVTFEYRPAPARGQSAERPMPPPILNESLHIMLRNGERLMVSQSADPASDRKVTVELTATILK
jgi:hypothetical protein